METNGGAWQMNRSIAAAMLLLPALAGAVRAQDTIPQVQYRGGSSTVKKRVSAFGVIVLTDSALQFIAYRDPNSTRLELKPMIVIPLDSLTDFSTAAGHRAAGADSTATDEGVDLVTLVYDTETSAEAPVFKLTDNMGGALLAKIKVRLRKLGLLPAAGGG